MRVAITGSSSGIGLATAKLLKSRGATIHALDVTSPPDGLGTFERLDVADPTSIERVAGATPGSLDALLCIAGIPPRGDNAAAILRVNFLGMRAFTRALLPKLATGASIVVLASRAGHRWRENIEQVKRLMALPAIADADTFVRDEKIDATRAYDLSKEAAIAWSMAMTEPLFAKNMRINTVSPSAVETRILGDFMTAFGAPVARNLERAGRPGKPEEIAEIAAFLASPQSGWLKGADIVPDGGISAFVTADRLGLAADLT